FLCRRGQPQLCEQMRFFGGQLPGGFAEYLVIPDENLLPIPAGVPERERVLTEPLAVGVHAVARARAGPGDEVVVIGAGAIGLFTALSARVAGAGRVVVGPAPAARRPRGRARWLEGP